MATTSALGTGLSVPLDYTSRDFQSILSDLQNAIPTFLPEWTSTSPNDFGVVLLECLAGDTPVWTSQGIMRLDVIKPGQRVHNAVGSGIVLSCRTVHKRSLVEVTVGGESLICSTNHPFLTQRGWVNADHLESQDFLIPQPEAMRVLRDCLRSTGSEQGSLLLSGLLQGLYEAETYAHLCSLPADILRPVDERRFGSPLLFQEMCRRVQEGAARPSGMCDLRENIRSTNRRRLSTHRPFLLSQVPIVLGTGASNMVPGHVGGLPWGVTSGTVSSLVRSRGSRGRMVPPVLDFSVGGASRFDLLSAGHRQSHDEGRCGSGRQGPLRATGRKGQYPSTLVRGMRVDRVEVHESGSEGFARLSGGEDSFPLYDLTVSGHPSFAVGRSGVLVHNCFSYVGDIQNYYVDRAANEAFLSTAVQRSSVLNLAYLIDYSPTDSSAAATGLTLTLAPNSPSFVLPTGSQFATVSTPTTAQIVFELSSTHTIPANTSGSAVQITSTTENGQSSPLTVVHGVTVSNEAVGTSNGNAGQSFNLYNTGVLVSTVAVFVDEGVGAKQWAQVSSLSDAGPYDSVYVVAEDANGVIYIVFGDSVNGRIPNSSAAITANYRVGGGVIGNVGSGQISVNLTGVSYITAVTNSAPAVGGADPETTAQIQVNAPKSITAAGRCVSAQDYASVALQVPGVSKASAVPSASAVAVNLYIHPTGGPFKASDLSSEVTALAPTLTWGGAGPRSSGGASGYLDTRKQIGATVVVLPPQVGGTTVGYVQIVLAVTVQVLPTFLAVQVSQDVTQAINTLFDFGIMNFGQRLTLSSVYHAIQSVSGVDYINVTSFYRSDGTSGVGDIICSASEIPVITDPDTGNNQITVTTNGGL